MRPLAYLLSFAVLAGCGDPGIIETPVAEAPAVAGPSDYALTPLHSALSVSARGNDGMHSTATLAVTGGNVRLEDGALTALELTVAAVPLHSGYFLTDVRVSLVSFEPDADTVRAAEHTLAGVATLRLDWALQGSRGPHRLQSQTVTGVGLVLDLAGTSDVLVDLQRAGTFWSWADIYELGDLDATLHGAGLTVE